jgi:hypothetical protein
MDILLTAIVTWLSVNFGLPANYDLPRVAFVTSETMHAVRYKGAGAGKGGSPSLQPGTKIGSEQLPELEAIYDDKTRTIYLEGDWSGKTPAELSVLVHEMVHHLQHAADLKYACAAEREKAAYAAQRRWLALYGLDLEDEFKLDPMTLLVRTNCLY